MAARRPNLKYGDKIGTLTFVGRVTLNSNARSPRYCSKFQCACGAPIETSTYSQSEVNRRRDRWEAMPGGEASNAMCGECARAGMRQINALHARVEAENTPENVKAARAAWNRLRANCTNARSYNNDVIGIRRNKLSQILDPLMFHIDRRWGHIYEHDADRYETRVNEHYGRMERVGVDYHQVLTKCISDGFEVFLRDMGLPPADKPMLLRRDPYKGWYKHNCYWGTGKERTANRVMMGQPTADVINVIVQNTSDRPDTHDRGGKCLSIGYIPYSAVQGSHFDPYVHRGVETGERSPLIALRDPNHPGLDSLRRSMADRAPAAELNRGTVVQRIERVLTQQQSAQRTY